MQQNYEKLSLLQWKVLFFQLLFTLATIHHTFPSFRHNDLKANNVLLTMCKIWNDDVIQKYEICKDSKNKNLVYKYKLNEHVYYVPCIGFFLKLWDFDFANIEGLVHNTKVNSQWANWYNIKSNQNQYYDIHFFFNTLIKKGFVPNIMTWDFVPTEIKNIIRKIVPEEYWTGKNVTEKGRILLDVEYTTPYKLITEDDFFLELKKKKN